MSTKLNAALWIYRLLDGQGIGFRVATFQCIANPAARVHTPFINPQNGSQDYTRTVICKNGHAALVFYPFFVGIWVETAA